ncbi:TFIIIC_sub6 domain-containing protein [Caenorhabditis elegans]|uniref:TFIIIC_sub6 domain-containing protein n=1 Tax=Caenorhabditis elegans TaxID=6239 RepID=Q22665_CAEEL|nr:TFIIIC_sub6 domain-containing protein [Caenorhabditis elegans]CAA99929.2 TFIIIC_sub6 domain-containing protein [Caenorhabditis elegans]|eukprot:NP_492191.2 Uncharacterized protein CELE_T22C1.5 [Caenorhabditis elegans]
MDSIFSDDEEFDTFRDQLYVGKSDNQDEKLVPMFGIYTLIKSDKAKPRQDLFLRNFVPPSSNELDPYEDGTFEHKKPIPEKVVQCTNFSYFGMNQSRFKIDDTTTSLCDHAIERKKLLEKLRRMDEETAEQDAEDEKENDENKEPESPNRTLRKTKVDTPRPKTAQLKRKRIIMSSDDDSEDEFSMRSSPRKKRVSPEI